jgi:hypothetical protein
MLQAPALSSGALSARSRTGTGFDVSKGGLAVWASNASTGTRQAGSEEAVAHCRSRPRDGDSLSEPSSSVANRSTEAAVAGLEVGCGRSAFKAPRLD